MGTEASAFIHFFTTSLCFRRRTRRLGWQLLQDWQSVL